MLTSDSVDPEIEERWQARFRAARMTLPQWSRLQPERCLFVSNASGTFELYRWDRSTDFTAQVTDRPAGTHIGAIDPSGEWIWWFDDADGNEFGIWRREPFSPVATAAGSAAGARAATQPVSAAATAEPTSAAAAAEPASAAAAAEPAEIAAPGLPASYLSGLCLGEKGLAVVGRSTDDGASIYVVRPDQEPVLLYAHQQDARVVALSHDDSLVAVEHSEHGDSRHTALRVLKVDGGASVGDLWDGPGLGLEAVTFAPVAGDTRLIARHERLGRWVPFIWDLASGEQHALGLEVELPGDVSATWYPDASGLLVAHEYQARSSLYRFDLATGTLEQLDIPAGTVSGATARPGGVVEFLWSSSAEPSAVRDSTGRIVVRPPGELAPSSVPAEDAWVDGPGGPIHALISKPTGIDGPVPTVFHIHGGPASYDADAFSPAVAAWVDAGFAVVRVNYRGSTGYGAVWRDAIEHRVGLTEMEDISAVRDWTVASGLADPTRIVLAGASWGGYLTLLGLGMSPDAWSVGVAGVPVADYVAAYEDEMEGLRAMDRALFGGTPDEVPDRYRQSSPLTYVDAVVAPVLVLAGANDPRCPIRQIDNYLARLASRAVPFEVYRFDAGHGSLVVEERISQMAAQLNYARRHLPAPQPAH